MRLELPLARASLLLNHGPTSFVTSAHGGKVNVMAMAWGMPLDFEPPKLAAVIEADSLTRELVEASGECVVSLPTVAQLKALYASGRVSGRQVAKPEALGLGTSPAKVVKAPLLDGCVGWLECKVVPEPHIQQAYDLFVLEVVAAWVDDAVWNGTGLDFSKPELRTVHHAAKNAFFATGERLEVTPQKRG